MYESTFVAMTSLTIRGVVRDTALAAYITKGAVSSHPEGRTCMDCEVLRVAKNLIIKYDLICENQPLPANSSLEKINSKVGVVT